VKQPIETDFDVRSHDAGVDVTFRPTESHYSFVLLADRRSVSPRASDMARPATLAIMPRVMSRQQHFGWPVPRSRVFVTR
jgi:hypothetical protein